MIPRSKGDAPGAAVILIDKGKILHKKKGEVEEKAMRFRLMVESPQVFLYEEAGRGIAQ